MKLQAVDSNMSKRNEIARNTLRKGLVRIGIERSAINEMLEKGIGLIHADLAEELLEKIERNSPEFFEKIVLDLLSSMGYGKGKVTGSSGDGGIDCFINQDALGIEKIYFQAKRFTGNTKVSASMIRDFVGSFTTNTYG